MSCPNCKREYDTKVVIKTKHHIIPKDEGGKNEESNYLYLCKDCHAQIHLLYDSKYLANVLNTAELILADEKMIKFAKFAKNQNKRIKKKLSKGNKRRR